MSVLPVLALAARLSILEAAAAPPEGGGAVYRVGPGDVLEIAVAGRPELSRLPTVQTSGAIFVPGKGDVDVRGLTTDEVAARVASALGGGPADLVTVRVREYHSQSVWVRGAVNRPGRKPLRSGTRLVDALLDAGGLTSAASGRVTVERATGALPDGTRRRVVRLTGASPSADELGELALALQAGDSVFAEAQGWISVTAGVARPGRYPFDDGLTLAGLVGMAGGRSGSGRVAVRRGGVRTETDLDAIRDGRAADVPLASGDEVVPGVRR